MLPYIASSKKEEIEVTKNDDNCKPAETRLQKKFASVESYMHRYAKDVVRSWFLEKNKPHRPSSYFIFDWNAHNDSFIQEEYPVLRRKSSNGSNENCNDIFGVGTVWGDNFPDLDNLKEGIEIATIFDLAIIDNGKVKYAIEIVHKHKCSAQKLVLLKEIKKKYGTQVYEIDASWVMSQVRRPAKIEMIAVN